MPANTPRAPGPRPPAKPPADWAPGCAAAGTIEGMAELGPLWEGGHIANGATGALSPSPNPGQPRSGRGALRGLWRPLAHMPSKSHALPFLSLPPAAPAWGTGQHQEVVHPLPRTRPPGRGYDHLRAVQGTCGRQHHPATA
eukprot:TsM_000084800 transcript=TsM_000084800 gene=TsM_000084800